MRHIIKRKNQESVRLVGVRLDTQLSFTDNHNIITKRINLGSSLTMKKVRNILRPETMKYHTPFFIPIYKFHQFPFVRHAKIKLKLSKRR